MFEAIRRMRPITLILGTAMALVLVLFSVSTAHGQTRDPRTEAARANTAAYSRGACNFYAGLQNGPTHGAFRFRCIKFGAVRCHPSPRVANEFRCTGYFNVEQTQDRTPWLGFHATATFRYKITPDGRSLRVTLLTTQPRWHISEYNASAE